MMVKTKEAWLMVSRCETPTGHRFTCESVWASKVVTFNLSVKSFPRPDVRRVYSMESTLLLEDSENYLFVPREDHGFVETVSLNA